MTAPPDHAQSVLQAVHDIRGQSRALQLYLEICARCGTCAEVCHVYQARPTRRSNPVLRSDHLRSLYKLAHSPLRRLRDKTDVVELILRRKLPRDPSVAPAVRSLYLETWDALQAES